MKKLITITIFSWPLLLAPLSIGYAGSNKPDKPPTEIAVEQPDDQSSKFSLQR